MVLFGLSAHARLPLLVVAVAGLSLAAAGVSRAILLGPAPLALLGLWPAPRRAALYILLGLALGLAGAAWYRYHLGWPLLPRAARGFVLVAAAIGGAEELLYRGYLQGRLRRSFAAVPRAAAEGEGGGAATAVGDSPWRLGAIAAVALAAACHAAYKTALFAFPPEGIAADLPLIAAATLLGGAVFGALREVSGSVLPALAAHVAFDLAVYAEQARAPWWVW
jgi:membrane protease YdiL (CAAX protease family)